MLPKVLSLRRIAPPCIALLVIRSFFINLPPGYEYASYNIEEEEMIDRVENVTSNTRTTSSTSSTNTNTNTSKGDNIVRVHSQSTRGEADDERNKGTRTHSESESESIVSHEYDLSNPTMVYPPLANIVLDKPPTASSLFHEELFTIDISLGQNKSTNETTITPDDTYTSSIHERGLATIDILSTGSTTRLNYLHSQVKSWASHVGVRNFWGVTERNDVHPNCTQDLISKAEDFVNRPLQITNEHFKWCKRTMANPTTDSNLMSLFRTFYGAGTRRKGPGWLCAQVRFGQALGKVGAEYRRRIQKRLNEIYRNENDEGEEEQSQSPRIRIRNFNDLLRYHGEFLPDYLLLVDDDTYVNLDLFQKLVKNATAHAETGSNDYVSGLHHDVNKPLVYAGCLGELKTSAANFSAYTGGYGVILSRGTVARMIQPIFCEEWKKREYEHEHNSTARTRSTQSQLSDVEHLNMRVCERIEENMLGEKERFVDGMTITDLSFELSKSPDDFCLNSDWLQSYLMGYYFLSDHMSPKIANSHDEGKRIIPFLHSEQTFRGSNGICQNNSPSNCDESKIICHYQTPDHMESLTRAIRAKSQDGFRMNS